MILFTIISVIFTLAMVAMYKLVGPPIHRELRPKPDYDLIRGLEQDIYGQVFTLTGKQPSKVLRNPQPKPADHESCMFWFYHGFHHTRCCPIGCSQDTQNIAIRGSYDVSDTYNIIEGEGI